MRYAARVAVIATALLVVSCSTVTSGHGSGAPAASSSSHPDFPSSSTTPAPSTSSGEPSATPTSATPSEQTRAARESQLRAQTAGDSIVLVGVPGGFEAASYDQSGSVRFWSESMSDTTWQLIGRSRYPNVPALGAPHATAEGALLRNMSDATFIVRGYFTGDGSGNAVAYTTGRRGWGTIKAEPNGNIGPSGRPIGANQIGLSYDFDFRRGYLITKDCPLDRPISDCDQHPIVKRWVWAGHDFVQL